MLAECNAASRQDMLAAKEVRLHVLATFMSCAAGSGGEAVVDGLVFEAGQLVRLQLSCSEVAAEEAEFAVQLRAFLGRAEASQKSINARAAALQVLLKGHARSSVRCKAQVRPCISCRGM